MSLKNLPFEEEEDYIHYFKLIAKQKHLFGRKFPFWLNFTNVFSILVMYQFQRGRHDVPNFMKIS